MATAAPNIKQEPVDDGDFEGRIVLLCQEHTEGINDAIIKAALPLSDSVQRVTALNNLLKTGRITVFQKKGTSDQPVLLYRLKDEATTAGPVKGADHQEKLVYQIISEAGNKGVWIREIRMRSNLGVPQLNKLVKNMESKKLIKAVKSVAAAKKKVYMLFDLEPDSTITGGAWYNDNKFDHEFADVLNQQCLRYLESKSASAKERHTDPLAQQNGALATADEVHRHITELGISTIKLTVNDIKDVLNTLIYDGKIKEITRVAAAGSTEEGQKLYRLLKPLIPTTGLMRVPCGVCPVIDQCQDEGAISPATCVYLKDWLNGIL
ncbi:DNA-directed RNA polymerase III subunit RPC6-like [Littorina saxatilis]|uniref:DNA-directed RNA polymerase III subunit RPC6 n=1 Tax=Littorina saxatilis TaxID=31220 RepID=A0AAN9GFP4_9CAEN